jgi:LPXTG-site transpeptidase (sortase) family protein
MKWLKNKHVAAGCLVLIAAVVTVSILTLSRSGAKSGSGAGKVITYSTSTPNESKQEADNYAWQGTAKEPKKITIPKISVNAFVQPMGVDQNKQVAVPTNVHLAGWFSRSVQPGERGLAIIDGHVTGRTAEGVFKNLDKLQPGDTFKVERGDGKVLSYKVVRTVTVPEPESANTLFSQDPKVTSQLNLITCSKFDRASNHYENRVIVSAVLVTT